MQAKRCMVDVGEHGHLLLKQAQKQIQKVKPRASMKEVVQELCRSYLSRTGAGV